MLPSLFDRPSLANGKTASKSTRLDKSRFGLRKIFGILPKLNCELSVKVYGLIRGDVVEYENILPNGPLLNDLAFFKFGKV